MRSPTTSERFRKARLMSDTATEGISITRTFDAPRELVFAAWTDPAQFAAWFGGSEATVPVETTVLDVRPGGEWSLKMLAGPAGELHFFGEYVEISPPARLVLTLSDGEHDDKRELITVTFTDKAGKTEMAFTQSGGNLTAEQYQATRDGWLAFFDALAGLFA
jgi:uncharacterized protein YndB with AHSA1/START domain